MEKAAEVDLPTEFKAPTVPGIDWDEIHEAYLAKLEEDRFVAAVEEGLADLEAGRTVSAADARVRLEKKFATPR